MNTNIKKDTDFLKVIFLVSQNLNINSSNTGEITIATKLKANNCKIPSPYKDPFVKTKLVVK